MRNMLEYLERSARRHPDRVAFHDDRDALTFSVLLAAARRIGSRLAQRVPPRQSVADRPEAGPWRQSRWPRWSLARDWARETAL